MPKNTGEKEVKEFERKQTVGSDQARDGGRGAGVAAGAGRRGGWGMGGRGKKRWHSEARREVIAAGLGPGKRKSGYPWSSDGLRAMLSS